MVEIIAISSGKGGVGKTTVVSNLGTALSSFGSKVVVVDCNFTNPHLSLSMGGFSYWPFTLNSVLNNEVGLEKAMYTHSSGLKIVPASFDIDDLKKINIYSIKSKIRSVFEDHDSDIVLLDSSPGLSKESIMTLKCAHKILFVATPHIPAVVDITKSCQLLRKQDAKPEGVILNRVKGRKYELKKEEVTQFTGLPVIATIPESDDVLRSTNFKVPVTTMSPGSDVSQSFMSLAADIIGIEYSPKMSAWKKLRGKIFQ